MIKFPKQIICFVFGFLLFICSFFSATSYGLEIYGFVDNSCRAITGLIVNADEENIFLLSVDGKFHAIPKNSVSNILVYNTVNNPITEIDLNSGLKDLLRDVYITDFNTPTLVGWPIQFVEDLIVFYDLQGKTNIIDQDKILSIKPAGFAEKTVWKVKNSAKAGFSFGNNLPDCKEPSGENLVQPTRMISDKIKINEFLQGYEDGFRNLRRFQQRTRFYARPFLFERETRLALVLTQARYSQELPSMLPLYLAWTSGRPYSHQSLVVIGSKPIEWLPNVEPVFAARSDLKLHFFNASLAGNLFALPAGRGMMISNGAFFGDYFGKFGDSDVMVVPHFNYLAMTGIDYERLSFSLGTYYPIFGVIADGYLREILATRSALLARFMYTTNSLRYKILYSSVNSSSSAPKKDEIGIVQLGDIKNPGSASSDALLGSLSKFKFKTYFVRTGFDLSLKRNILLGLDEVFLKTDYSESLLGSENHVDFNQYTTATYLKQQFSNYVALVGYLNLIYRKFDNQVGNDDDKKTVTKYSASVAVEFML